MFQRIFNYCLINSIILQVIVICVIFTCCSDGLKSSNHGISSTDDGSTTSRHIIGLTPHPTLINTIERPLLLLHRAKRGSAYAGGYNDFSGIAKQSTFAALGSYGGFIGHGHGSSSGVSVPNALGMYGQYSRRHGPTVLSSGGYGQGGLLFGKI